MEAREIEHCVRSQPLSLSLSLCDPSTTICTGFKSSSLQPASGDEKLFKLTVGGEKKAKKSGQLSQSPAVGRYKKRAPIKQTSRSESALFGKHVHFGVFHHPVVGVRCACVPR